MFSDYKSVRITEVSLNLKNISILQHFIDFKIYTIKDSKLTTFLKLNYLYI